MNSIVTEATRHDLACESLEHGHQPLPAPCLCSRRRFGRFETVIVALSRALCYIARHAREAFRVRSLETHRAPAVRRKRHSLSQTGRQ